MSKSALLRIQDVRAILQLVGECRDLGDDPAAWQQHLLKTVAGLIGGATASTVDMVGLWGPPIVGQWVFYGSENGTRQETWLEAMAWLKDHPRLHAAVLRVQERFRQEDGVAHTRTDLFSDREWEATADCQLYRAMGVDHCVACYRLFPGAADRFRSFTLGRAVGDRDFSRREVMLLHEVQAAIVPLIGGPLARGGEPSPADLAPRVRQVLRCLLEGDGDKQIAARLGLTRHTVNHYMKTLFRHFGVQSRAELLARWVRRGFPAGFSWAAGLESNHRAGKFPNA